MELKFRDLTAKEVEVKKAQGGMLLLYKTARVDANILDETVGIPNWQKIYEVLDGKVYCKIGIITENGWVWKMDCGEETAIEAAKGEASDAMKRAGFAWGIGRKLYNSPRIKDPNPSDKYARYYVRDIAFDEVGVSRLLVVDAKGNEVFSSGANKQPAKPQPTQPTATDPLDVLAACKEFDNAQTADECRAVWSKYPALQRNEDFVQAKIDAKIRLSI